MKNINFHANLGTFAKSSVIARLFVDGLSKHFTINLPLYGKDHKPGRINEEEDQYFKEFIQPSLDIDTNIFYDMPMSWKPQQGKKNIGIFGWETTKIPCRDLMLHPNIHPGSFNWTKMFNSMDEVWCLSKFTEQAMRNGGVTVPLKVIKPPLDTTFWQPGIWEMKEPVVGLDHDVHGEKLYDKFVVGFVGEWCHKNDPVTLLKLLMVGLPVNDTVIVLKIHSMKNGVTKEALANAIKKIKTETYLPKLPTIVLIDNYLDEKEYAGLLNKLTVYVSVSKGECYNLPALEAMSLGKLCVLPTHSANSELLKDKETGFGVNFTPELAFNPDEGVMPSSPYYSSDQLWCKANELEVIQHLQTIHQEWQKDKTLLKYKRLGLMGSEFVDKHFGYKQFNKAMEEYK
jgi:glycosyltransferase involved in cell wall biosynthesis